MLMCAFLTTIAHETAGAARTRHSLRPLIGEGDTFKAKLARNARREREGVFSSFRDAPLGAGPESIAQQSWWINGFRACAEWRIYDARLRIGE